MLTQYLHIAEGIAGLLAPFGEVVLHDLKTGKVFALFNNLSKRKLAEESFIGKGELPDIFEPYIQTNWDGKKFKSTSITLRDDAGEPIGLLCINIEISPLLSFLDVGELPKQLFADDGREQITHFVNHKMRSLKKSRDALTRDEKRVIIHELRENGAFKTKGAATIVAQLLDLSRATIYKDLS